jgi:glutamine synthetase
MHFFGVDGANAARPLPELLGRELAEGVRTVRVLYCDIHGIARGKDIPVGTFPAVVKDGLAFCQANLMGPLNFTATNLGRIPATVLDPSFPDMRIRPLAATMARLP